jgi:multidrug efflux system membrane fusion protein
MATMRDVSHNQLSRLGATPQALDVRIAVPHLRNRINARPRQHATTMLTGSARDLKRPTSSAENRADDFACQDSGSELMRAPNDDRSRSSANSSARGWSWLALLLPVVLAGCGSEAKVEQEVVRPVKAIVVGEAARERTLTYSGVVRPRIESAMGFRVAGKIVQRLVNIGDRVEIGQIVARLDDTDLKLAEGSAKAALAAARTRRDVAIDNFERARMLLPKAFIAKATFDARKNEMDAAIGAFDSAEAQLSQAINAAGYATLRADKAGIVTAVRAEPGQVVNAGTPIIVLAESGETEIAIVVPEQDVARLAIGQPIDLTLWAGPRTSLKGSIREISAQAESDSRTYAVRATVHEPPAAMRLGMTATVSIKVEDAAASVVVPLTAVTEIGGSTVVFVVEPASRTVRKKPVTLAATAPEGVGIAGGLEPGDIVVTAGVQFLRDGMKVRLPADVEQRAANSKSADYDK